MVGERCAEKKVFGGHNLAWFKAIPIGDGWKILAKELWAAESGWSIY